MFKHPNKEAFSSKPSDLFSNIHNTLPIAHKQINNWQDENLNGAVEDTAKTDPVLEDLVDLHYGVVGLLRSTVCHIVYVQYHLRHFLQKP